MQEWFNLYGEALMIFALGLSAIAIPLAGFTAYEAIKGLIQSRTHRR